MTMGVIDSYPEIAPESEKQASPAAEMLHLAGQKLKDNPLAALRSLVIDSVSAPNSKRAYGRAVDNFLVGHQQQNPGPFSKAVLQAYRAGLEQRGLAPATINVHLSALRRLAAEAADNGLLDPDIAAGIARVKGTSGQGVRTGNYGVRRRDAVDHQRAERGERVGVTPPLVKKLHAKEMEGHARQDCLVKLVAFVAKVGDDSTGELVAVKLQ